MQDLILRKLDYNNTTAHIYAKSKVVHLLFGIGYEQEPLHEVKGGTREVDEKNGVVGCPLQLLFHFPCSHFPSHHIRLLSARAFFFSFFAERKVARQRVTAGG